MNSRLHFGFGARRLPVILQTEAAECSLACLAMIASHHGYRCDLASLRRRFSFSLKGVTLADVVRMAGELLLSARPLRAELDQLDQRSRILELGFARIDLRDPDMIAVRPRDVPETTQPTDGGA